MGCKMNGKPKQLFTVSGFSRSLQSPAAAMALAQPGVASRLQRHDIPAPAPRDTHRPPAPAAMGFLALCRGRIPSEGLVWFWMHRFGSGPLQLHTAHKGFPLFVCLFSFFIQNQKSENFLPPPSLFFPFFLFSFFNIIHKSLQNSLEITLVRYRIQSTPAPQGCQLRDVSPSSFLFISPQSPPFPSASLRPTAASKQQGSGDGSVADYPSAQKTKPKRTKPENKQKETKTPTHPKGKGFVLSFVFPEEGLSSEGGDTAAVPDGAGAHGEGVIC